MCMPKCIQTKKMIAFTIGLRKKYYMIKNNADGILGTHFYN